MMSVKRAAVVASRVADDELAPGAVAVPPPVLTPLSCRTVLKCTRALNTMVIQHGT
jgi:hypothetical protein